jgi:dTDP-4-amino-4,6-dideoxygalactose transaminase
LVFEELRKKGVFIQVLYIPVYMHPYYRRIGYRDVICSQAEDFYKREISIPLFQSLKDKDRKEVVNSLLVVIQDRKI